MRINWEKVKAYFCLQYKEFSWNSSGTPISLYEWLVFLYSTERLTWKEIAKMTNGYVCKTTIRKKAKELEIKSRPRGGPNHTKKEVLKKLLEEEYYSCTTTSLARKYGVSRATIVKMAKEKGWSLKRSSEGTSKG